MRIAAIDIGTNTVLLLVAEERNGQWIAVEEHATITRLGEHVDKTRRLAPKAITRTNLCLDRYAEVVERLGATRVDIVGTSAMRDARGGEAVRDHVAARFGIPARTLSGDEEARLTFSGALSGLSLPPGRVLVFDIGGGSTEVVGGDSHSRAIAFAASFDIGSVRLTERCLHHDPPISEEQDAVLRASDEAFAGVPDRDSGTPVVGIAGTVTTLAAIALGLERYDSTRVHGQAIETRELIEVVERLAAATLEERKKIAGLDANRADVIVAGGLIAISLLRRIRAETVLISDRGVRWGLVEQAAQSVPTRPVSPRAFT